MKINAFICLLSPDSRWNACHFGGDSLVCNIENVEVRKTKSSVYFPDAIELNKLLSGYFNSLIYKAFSNKEELDVTHFMLSIPEKVSQVMEHLCRLTAKSSQLFSTENTARIPLSSSCRIDGRLYNLSVTVIEKDIEPVVDRATVYPDLMGERREIATPTSSRYSDTLPVLGNAPSVTTLSSSKHSSGLLKLPRLVDAPSATKCSFSSYVEKCSKLSKSIDKSPVAKVASSKYADKSFKLPKLALDSGNALKKKG